MDSLSSRCCGKSCWTDSDNDVDEHGREGIDWRRWPSQFQ